MFEAIAKQILARIVERRFGLSPEAARFLIDALIKYGHLVPSVFNALFSKAKLESILLEAVRSYQRFHGLDHQDGITPQFVRVIQTPRCGCPDLVRSEKVKRRSNVLRYNTKSFVTGLSQSDQIALQDKAFSDWAQFADLDIKRATATSNVTVSTGRGRQSGFDGRGGTLAWAYLAGDLMVYDLDELWRASNFQRVSRHEFGHILGLEHSQNPDDVMYAYLNEADTLTANDQRRIIAMYGARQTPIPPQPDKPTPGPEIPGGEIVLAYTGTLTSAVVKEVR